MVRVKCKITKGAFSGERIIRIKLDDNEEYVGVVPRSHCFSDNTPEGTMS